MTVADPFHIDTEALPQLGRPVNARHKLPVPDEGLDSVGAERLSEEITYHHHVQSRGMRTALPMEEWGQVSYDDEGRKTVNVTTESFDRAYAATKADRRPLGRWKRSAAMSRKAFHMVAFYAQEQRPVPRHALIALSHALGIRAKLDTRQTAVRLVQILGRRTARGEGTRLAGLAERAYISKRATQQLLNNTPSVAKKLDVIERFWQGRTTIDLRTHVTDYRVAVAHERESWPADIYLRVVAAYHDGGAGSAPERAAAREVAYHLVAGPASLGEPPPPEAVTALAFALGLVTYTKPRGNW